jgi:hypothetical protein
MTLGWPAVQAGRLVADSFSQQLDARRLGVSAASYRPPGTTGGRQRSRDARCDIGAFDLFLLHQNGKRVAPPSYLLAQKRLLKSAAVRLAKSTTSELRLATRSLGARHFLRVSDPTLALSNFTARRALRRFRLHLFGLVEPSARITRPAIRSSAGSREQCLHPQASPGSFNVARTVSIAHSTPASDSSGS